MISLKPADVHIGGYTRDCLGFPRFQVKPY
jgi:hypothetical protein